MAGGRSPEMIRAEIEETRRELTNWRGQRIRNRKAALIGAAVAGFVIGGGVAATVSIITGRR